MKVTTDTPELLIIDDRPVLIGILMILFTLVFLGAGIAILLQGELMGLFFAAFGGGMGLLFFVVMVRRVQLVCHRPEGWVEIRRRSLFGAGKVRYPLTEVSRAVLESTFSDGTPVHRVALEFDTGQSAGRHLLSETYVSGSSRGRAVEAINRWLDA